VVGEGAVIGPAAKLLSECYVQPNEIVPSGITLPHGFVFSRRAIEFGSTEITQLFRNYNSQTAQKLNQIHAIVDETQALMTHNLTMALIRGQQLTVMEGKAEDIRASAESFGRVAEKVKCQMCVQKWRWIVLGIIIGLVMIFIIVWICCGAKFEKCGNTRKEGGK
jgi:hypothetical protein